MTYTDPLKLILEGTRDIWDRPKTRPDACENFLKVIYCRTPALGAEVYASEIEQKLVYHTCKSRLCPTCGQLATEQWQREQMAALPDIPYAGIVFTMPNVLWPIFQRNRHLLPDLAVLGAAVIKQWVKLRYGVRVMVMVMPHTFKRNLGFNPHLHILVSSAGLRESDGAWIQSIRFSRNALMPMWRYALVTYLRQAFKANVLASDLDLVALKRVFTTQYERWWSTRVDHFKSKEHFLRYAGRYVRRPPIAQRRFLKITDEEVLFWTKDLREKRIVETRYTSAEFVSLLAEHVPERYQHAMRYFGLLAPRAKARTSAAIFLLLGQKRRPRPRRWSWAFSLRAHFGVDPLRDSSGRSMHWIGRLEPTGSG